MAHSKYIINFNKILELMCISINTFCISFGLFCFLQALGVMIYYNIIAFFISILVTPFNWIIKDNLKEKIFIKKDSFDADNFDKVKSRWD